MRCGDQDRSWYTGVGSRHAPTEIVRRCVALAIALQKLNMSLRTGDAIGCDAAFSVGAGGRVIGTSAGMVERESPACTKDDRGTRVQIFKPTETIGWTVGALRACLDYSEDLSRRPELHRRLLLRNMRQVLGPRGEDPSNFLVYWSPEPNCVCIDRRKSDGGGTRYAVRRAHLSGVPCFHLSEKTDDEILAFCTNR